MGDYTLNYDDPLCIYQKLYTGSIDENRTEALKARVKDPLWFLSRQLEFGEFLAESGGFPVKVEISYSELPIRSVRHSNNTTEDYDARKPMEWYTEDEKGGQKPTDWDERRLEYAFGLECPGAKLHAEEYYSGDLDWYDFTLEGEPDFTGQPVKTLKVVPTNIVYRGMPALRYWAFEDGSVNFKSIIRQDENILTTMVLIFSQLTGEDWYMVPIGQNVGTLRKIHELKVYDNFDREVVLRPVEDASSDSSRWSMFTLASKNGTPADASLFFLPNTISVMHESEDLEEVTFIRDEMMNLAWAVENKYEKDGKAIDRNDEMAMEHEEKDNGRQNVSGRKSEYPVYTEMGEVPENWVPYFPVRITLSGQMALVRGRAAEIPGLPYNPTSTKGMIINESRVLDEEEIPAAPISVVRKYNLVNLGRDEQWALARDAAGKLTIRRTDAGSANILLWSSREKKVGKKVPLMDLKFDTVE